VLDRRQQIGCHSR